MRNTQSFLWDHGITVSHAPYFKVVDAFVPPIPDDGRTFKLDFFGAPLQVYNTGFRLFARQTGSERWTCLSWRDWSECKPLGRARICNVGHSNREFRFIGKHRDGNDVEIIGKVGHVAIGMDIGSTICTFKVLPRYMYRIYEKDGVLLWVRNASVNFIRYDELMISGKVPMVVE